MASTRSVFSVTLRFLVIAAVLISAPRASAREEGQAAGAAKAASKQASQPLRVFVRSGPKSHGPGAHDYPRFLKEWVPMLNERGARATGAETFPTREQLAETDVLILHKQEAGNIEPAERVVLNEFLARGGGVVVIHAGIVSRDPDWFKTIVGGAWRNGTARWLEGPMHLYFTDPESPITRDASNWEMDDEIYWDLEMMPDVRILASAYTPKAAGARNVGFQRRAEELTSRGRRIGVYDIQPQMWTYERTVDGGKSPYRAFVAIPGHMYENFNRPNFRAILLRGITWAAGRSNLDELVKKEELGDALRYPDGGPVHPSKAAATIEVHPDFNLSLVAAEPLIAKPMNIDWDERGRLWVSETPEYPNGRRPQNTQLWKDSGSLVRAKATREPEDTISILTDTNKDGVMDKRHVFADKLELVTGFVLHKNGVIAATSPDIWLLEDTNGDEVADKRTKLYTGLGIYDTHAVINNLRWGLDGWVYATHGYSVGNVTSPDGKQTFGRDASGVVRFKPDGSAFEQYSSRGGNTWGLDITWNGQVFWTQPTSGTVLFHTVLPESILAKGRVQGTTSWKGMITGQATYPRIAYKDQPYIQIDQVGQFTAAAGCAIYDGGAWPDAWRFSYFTGEPTLNLVHHQLVKPEGVSYTSAKDPARDQTEFMRSGDMWFRPIETRVGPDGALYVVDFYNQAVIHNDTRGPQHGPANAAVRPDRDHYFGRIWKVQHKQAKALPAPSLDRKDVNGLIQAIESNPNAQVRMTAWRLAQENHGSNPRVAAIKKPMGSEAQALYEKSLALKTDAERQALLQTFAKAGDNWTRSAIVAAATGQASAYVAEAFRSPAPEALTEFVVAVAPSALPAGADAMIAAAAAAPAAAAPLKAAAMRAVSRMEGGSVAMTPAATKALQALLSDPATAAATLPVVAKWDKAGALSADADAQGKRAVAELGDAVTPDDRRADIAASLLGVPARRAETLAAITTILENQNASDALKSKLIATLGENPGPDTDKAMIAALAKTRSTPLFDQVVRRPESTRALLAAMKAGEVTPANLGPGNVARLRTHPNRAVAKEAAALLDTLSPSAKEKETVIASLTAEVEKPGDVEKGRALFTGACSTCHRYGNLGKIDVGPPLNGMGAHGRAALLAHIIDPNREVDPSFWQWNVTTKQGTTLSGVIVSENSAGLTLRNANGDVEVKKEEIVSRDNTRLSLMPEGLESLGAEALRDILTFMTGDGAQYRVVDMRTAYNSDSRRSLRTDDAPDDTVTLLRFGDVTVNGVPFFVLDPARATGSGMNFVALKGGPGSNWLSEELPRRVEIAAPVTAASLHMLGGVGAGVSTAPGAAGKPLPPGTPVMKVIVQYADGTTEEHVLKYGEQIADAFSRVDVPGSIDAGDFTRRGQLRYLAFNLGKKAALAKIILESYDTEVVPATVAITAGSEPVPASPGSKPAARGPAAADGAAELKLRATSAEPVVGRGFSPANDAAVLKLRASAESAVGTSGFQDAAGPKEGGKGDAPLPPVKPVVWAPGKAKVLIVGGGSAHDFGKFFGGTDAATLEAAGFSVNYTEDRDQAAAELAGADVAVISVNRQFFDTPAWRKALFDFAAAGKGLVMLHPGTWYGFANWPELNATIVGGGARGHDRIAAFSVNALKPEHPVMKGVPVTFQVEDELYYLNAEPDKVPAGTAAIEVLAETSPSVRFKKPHPAVWITSHSTARIVGISLGHDQRTHDADAFKTVLVNAVRWAGRSK